MRTLALYRNKERMSYAVFDGIVLEKYGNYEIEETKKELKYNEFREKLRQLLRENKIDLLATAKKHVSTTEKQEYEFYIGLGIVIGFVAEEENVLYHEFKFDGWQKKLLNGRATSKKLSKRLNIIYGIKIPTQNTNLIKAINLGEAVAHNRLWL